MKKIGVLLLTVLMLGMMMVGCQSQTPTDVVNSYFKEVKKENSEQANKFINNAISETEKNTSEKEKKDDDKIMEEALKLYLSKINHEVVDEYIDGNFSRVKVKVKGPNFYNIMVEIIQESLTDAFSGKDINEEDISKKFLEKVKSSKDDTRSGTIYLEQKNNKWKVKADDNVVNLILGRQNNTSEKNK